MNCNTAKLFCDTFGTIQMLRKRIQLEAVGDLDLLLNGYWIKLTEPLEPHVTLVLGCKDASQNSLNLKLLEALVYN